MNILISENYMLKSGLYSKFYGLYIYIITFKNKRERERRGRWDSQERLQAEAGVTYHKPRGLWSISAGRCKGRLGLMLRTCDQASWKLKQEDWKSKTWLGYNANSRAAWGLQQEPVLKCLVYSSLIQQYPCMCEVIDSTLNISILKNQIVSLP